MKKILKKLLLAYLKWERQTDADIAEMPEIERTELVKFINDSTY